MYIKNIWKNVLVALMIVSMQLTFSWAQDAEPAANEEVTGEVTEAAPAEEVTQEEAPAAKKGKAKKVKKGKKEIDPEELARIEEEQENMRLRKEEAAAEKRRISERNARKQQNAHNEEILKRKETAEKVKQTKNEIASLNKTIAEINKNITNLNKQKELINAEIVRENEKERLVELIDKRNQLTQNIIEEKEKVVDNKTQISKLNRVMEDLLDVFELADGTLNWSKEYNISDKAKFTNGKWSVHVKARDNMNNVSDVVARNVIIDPKSDIPTLNIINPTPRMRVPGNLKIVGTAFDDDAVDKVEISIDAEKESRTAIGTDFWYYDLDTSDLKDGIHFIRVKCYDLNGTPSREYEVWFNLDRRTPFIDITTIQSGEIVSGVINVGGTSSDDNGIESIEYSLDDRDTFNPIHSTRALNVNRSTMSWHVKINTDMMPDGVQNIWFRSTDLAGSVAYYPLTVVCDHQKPTIYFQYPKAKEKVGMKFNVMGFAQDNLELLSLKFAIDKGPWQEVGMKPGNPLWTHIVDLTGTKPGRHVLRAVVEDVSGNKNETSVDIMTVADKKPVLTLRSLKPDQPVSDSLQLYGEAADEDGIKEVKVSIKRDGGSEPIYVASIPSEFSFSTEIDLADRSKFSDGKYVVECIPVNINGAEGDAQKGTFVIDRGAPSIDVNSIKNNIAGKYFRGNISISGIKINKGGELKYVKYSIRDVSSGQEVVAEKDITFRSSNTPAVYDVDTISETIEGASPILQITIKTADANDNAASVTVPFIVDDEAPSININNWAENEEDGVTGSPVYLIQDNSGYADVKIKITSPSDAKFSKEISLKTGDRQDVTVDVKGLDGVYKDYVINVKATDKAGNEKNDEKAVTFKKLEDAVFTIRVGVAPNQQPTHTLRPLALLPGNNVSLNDVSYVVFAVFPPQSENVHMQARSVDVTGTEINKEYGIWMLNISERELSRFMPGENVFSLMGSIRGTAGNAGNFTIVSGSSDPRGRILWPPSSLYFNKEFSLFFIGANDTGSVTADYVIDAEPSDSANWTAVSAERIDAIRNYQVPSINPVKRDIQEQLIGYAVNNNIPINPVTDKLFKVDLPVTEMSPGLHTVHIRIKDDAGKMVSKSFEFTYQNTSPTLKIWAPDGKDNLNGMITIRGEAENAQTVVALHNKDEITATGRVRWDIDYSLGDLDEIDPKNPGIVTKDIMLYAIDRAGNRTEATLTINIDNGTDAPEVVINSPAIEDQRFTDIIEIGGVALDDDGIDFVQYRIDYGDPGSVLDKVKKAEVQWTRIDVEKGNPNWSKKIPKDAISSGRHKLEVQAIDLYGIASEIKEIHFHVDNENPEITISMPQTGEYLRGETTITGRARDPNEIDFVEISTNYGWTFSRAEGNSSWTYYFDSRSVPDGPLRVLIRARDKAGSEAFSFGLYNIDNTPPEIDILLPKDGMSVNNVYKVVGRAKDNVGIDTVKLYVDGNLESKDQIYGTETEGRDKGFFELDGREAWEFDLDTTNLVRLDKYQLVARVTDLSGNMSEKSLNFTVNLMSDFPNVTIDQPQPGQHLSGRTLDFFGTASDDDAIDRVLVKIDDEDMVEARGKEMWNYSLSTVGLQPGVHRLSVVVYEKPVNEGDQPKMRSLTRQFYYDNGGPVINVASHINGAPMEHRPWMFGTAEYFEDNLELKLKEQIQHKKYLELKMKYRRDQAKVEELKANVDKIPVTPAEVASLKKAYLAENAVSAIYLSLDNGNTYTKAIGTPENWKIRVQTQYLQDGDHVLQIKAVTKNGKESLRYFRVWINRNIPDVIIDTPMDSAHINDRLSVRGSADDDGSIESVKILFRRHDKNLGKVPQFVQGLYLWLQVFGGPYVSGGIGLSFFDDIVRVEAMFGWVPTVENMDDILSASGGSQDQRFFTPEWGWKNYRYEPRFSGFIAGGKLLARIIDIPYEFFFGEDAKNFSFSVELGCAFYWFSGYGAGTGEKYNLVTDKSDPDWAYSAYNSKKSKVLAGFMVQADLFKIERWAIFRKFAFYFEAAFFFNTSEQEGGLFPQFGFGIRNALF
ncbi:MAG: hypothetical protein IKQ61_07555 [Spirochaetales bacterium]|nr:hypothetical protein [Spirochaetales bacterium]